MAINVIDFITKSVEAAVRAARFDMMIQCNYNYKFDMKLMPKVKNGLSIEKYIS
jgi:hypothetical protein